MIEKKLLLSALFIFSFVNLHSQKIPLSEENANWTTVLGGSALCKPQETSYGYAILTDGKLLTACTEKGKKLWEKSIPGKSSPILTKFSSDFLLTVSNSTNLVLTNPSGKILWKKNLNYPITSEPFVGRDKRIFVKGSQNISCLGVNGIIKWSLSTDILSDDNFFELNDGSILVFLKTSSNENTKALRISPFGEYLEHITFSGKVIYAKSLEKGLFLYFVDGKGLCYVKNNQTISSWKNTVSSQNDFNKNIEVIEFPDNKIALIKENSKTISDISIISEEKGTEICNFKAPLDFSIRKNSLAGKINNKLFLSDRNSAYIFNLDGKIDQDFSMPSSKDKLSSWNQILLSQTGNLVFCTNTWIMSGFKLSQKLKSKPSNAGKKRKIENYENFYTINESYFENTMFTGSIGSDLIGKNRKSELYKGNYANREIEYCSSLLTFDRAYRSYLMENKARTRPDFPSVFDMDSTGLAELVSQLNAFGTDTFTKTIAFMIKSEKKDYILKEILKSVCECGFDPNDAILSAIDERFSSINSSDTDTLRSLCDAVYEICRFMGRPAFFDHGISILTSFSGPKYSREIKLYASQTLTKIASLKI